MLKNVSVADAKGGSMAFLRKVREGGNVVDASTARQLRDVRSRIMDQHLSGKLPCKSRSTYGGLITVLKEYDAKVVQSQPSFSIHDIYMAGDPLICEESGTICFVLSSHNLLLNAYRQEQFGLPGFLQIDTQYRKVVEGYGWMPIGTTSIDMQFHLIGWGCVSKENRYVFYHMFKGLKAAVESAVHAEAKIGNCI